jgi:hypothetical protein
VFINLLGREQVLDQHADIATAIAEGDPERARAALKRHVGYLDEVRRNALTALDVDDVPVSQLPLRPEQPSPRGRRATDPGGKG